MDCSMPGFPVLHCLPEFAQAHVHCISDAIQPSHTLLPPSPLALSLFQHQGLFQLFTSIGQSPGALASAPVLTRNIQGWLPLGWTGLISSLSKDLSSVFSTTIVQKHQFFSTQPSLWSNSLIHTWLLEKPWVQFSSVAHHVRIFAVSWKGSMPGLPVHHQLPELAQTHVHQVSDAIQTSHPLSYPSPPALSQS